MKEIYQMYSDPGHGWLVVPLRILVKLGIDHQISGYSYTRNGNVYLEEDRDAGIFLRAMRDAGHPVRIKENISDRMSRIRGYDRYIRYIFGTSKIHA